jgi:hypothetical protein
LPDADNNEKEASAMTTTKWALALLGLLAGLMRVGAASAETALEMAGYCEPYRTAVMTGPNEVRVNANANSHACWGAFAAVQGLGTISFPDTPEQQHTALWLCLPEKSTRAELIKVYLRYVDQHPNEGHKDFGVVVLNALWQAFPCPPPKGAK